MSIVSETLKFEIPPKEKVQLLVKQGGGRGDFLSEITDYCQEATDADKAICLAAVNQITREDPSFIKDRLDFIISQINSKSAQVKMEAGEIIANSAKTFPDEASKAIPALTSMADDQLTIIRLSAAAGLVTIARNNPKAGKELKRFFKAAAKREKQSSVRNIYLEALDSLGKAK